MEIVEDQVVKLKHFIRYCGLTFEDMLFELKRVIYENAMDTQYSELIGPPVPSRRRSYVARSATKKLRSPSTVTNTRS